MPISPLDDAAALVEAQLRAFILSELAPGAGRLEALQADDPLFESVLDSTSILALVQFLETRFQIEIPDQDVVPSHFSTLRRLGAYVTGRRSPAPLERAAAVSHAALAAPPASLPN